jgi:hypothetical protein
MATMFGCERPAAFWASRRKRSTKPASFVEDLDRDAPAQLLVLREVDRGHAARAESAQDAVARVEDAPDVAVACVHEVTISPSSVRVPA